MELDDIMAALPAWPLEPVGAGTLSQIPEQWRPIAGSADPESRCAAALALWNQGFLDLVPEFAQVLRAHCLDVRVFTSNGVPALTYALEGEEGEPALWVGHDPRTFVEPAFWESFPKPVQMFLREVHAGFEADRDGGLGIARPIAMETLAERAEFPDGIPGWEENDIPSTRLLEITSDGGILLYCVSPDLEVGKIALVYEGDIDPKDLGEELDELLMSHIDEPGTA